MDTQLHYGHIVEKVIRKNGYSITDLAKATQVNRRSVYNWFNQRHLKPDIIYRIGKGINYDFSAEFPHLFIPEHFNQDTAAGKFSPAKDAQANAEAEVWKLKYLTLLERYNALLLRTLHQTVKAS